MKIINHTKSRYFNQRLSQRFGRYQVLIIICHTLLASGRRSPPTSPSPWKESWGKKTLKNMCHAVVVIFFLWKRAEIEDEFSTIQNIILPPHLKNLSEVVVVVTQNRRNQLNVEILCSANQDWVILPSVKEKLKKKCPLFRPISIQ